MHFKYLFLFAFLIMLNCGLKETKKKSEEAETTVYYLIRHAEKDRSNPQDANPLLTEKGLQRAQNWALYFDTIPLAAVYSTDYIRTKLTATPTAKSKNLELQIYQPNALYDSVFKASTSGKKVLIVGHSNTTPMLVNKIVNTNNYEDLNDDDFSSLFIVTIKNNQAKATVVRID